MRLLPVRKYYNDEIMLASDKDNQGLDYIEYYYDEGDSIDITRNKGNIWFGIRLFKTRI
jgi:maltose-binding protein MalE